MMPWTWRIALLQRVSRLPFLRDHHWIALLDLRLFDLTTEMRLSHVDSVQ